MKGKLYNPHSASTQFIKWKTPEIRNMQTKILYIWDTSIPETWKNVSRAKSIPMIKLNGKNKNTLQFLEETQKYISCITKPLAYERSYRISENRLKRKSLVKTQKLSSESEIPKLIMKKNFYSAGSLKENGLIRLKKKIYTEKIKKREKFEIFGFKSSGKDKDRGHSKMKTDIFTNF